MRRMPPVLVPRAVLDGLHSVRDSGLTNMLDRPRVADIAARLGHRTAALWVREHPSEYATGVFQGFRAAE